MHIKQVLIDRGIPFSEENGMVICNQYILDLRYSQITSLDGFTFNGMHLYLTNNQITSLAGFTFNGNYLDLDDNPINIETIITREIWEREYSDPYVNLFLNCASRPSGAGI